MLLHERAEHAYLLILVLVEVEPIASAVSDLQEVVVQAFLGDPNFLGGFVEGPSREVSVIVLFALLDHAQMYVHCSTPSTSPLSR